MYRKVDPAALIFAIFTVAFSPLITLGPWDKINTVIAVAVGAVLVAFTWPRNETLKDESGRIPPFDGWITAAQAIAYGFVIAIGTAWFVQLIWRQFLTHPPDCTANSYGNYGRPCLELADSVTRVVLGIGSAAAIILFIWMRNRNDTLRRSSPRPPLPLPPPLPAPLPPPFASAFTSAFADARAFADATSADLAPGVAEHGQGQGHKGREVQ